MPRESFSKILSTALADPVVFVVSGVPLAKNFGAAAVHELCSAKLAVVVIPMFSGLRPWSPIQR